MKRLRTATGLIVALLLAACSGELQEGQTDATTFQVRVVNTGEGTFASGTWKVQGSSDQAGTLAQTMEIAAEGSSFTNNVYEFSVDARPGDALSVTAATGGATLTLDSASLFSADGHAVQGELAGADDLKVIVMPESALDAADFSLPTSYFPNIKLLGGNQAPDAVTTPAYGEAEALLIFKFLIVTGSFGGLEGDLLEIAGSPAHVHKGARGETGDIVFNLDVTARGDKRGGAISAFTYVEDVKGLLNGEYYINIHSEAHPGGELRGQISAEQAEGAVFTVENEAKGNDILSTVRWSDGRIFGGQSFKTGGDGSGGGLSGTSNPLVVSKNNDYLFAVSAGSNEITSFKVSNLTNLERIDTDGSGGVFPISVAVFGDLLYVLNAGDDDTPGNIAGFRIGQHGRLRALGGSKQLLDGKLNDDDVPAQILFSPNGRYLVVTDRAADSNTITTFRVRNNGRAEAPVTQPSVGAGPFGFEFAPNGVLVVSEAFGDAANDLSAVSSYDLESVRRGSVRFGELSPISESVPTERIAACWVEITENGRYAYTTNTGSGDVTGFRLRDDGTLERLPDDIAFTTTGAGPLDIENVGSDFLYIHSFEDDGDSQIASYRVVEGTGELVSLSSRLADLPDSTRGVAAY